MAEQVGLNPTLSDTTQKCFVASYVWIGLYISIIIRGVHLNIKRSLLCVEFRGFCMSAHVLLNFIEKKI